MATWETTWSGVWFLQLWLPCCVSIRANGDKERTEGLWLSWGWKGGDNPFSEHHILWPDQEKEGGDCRPLLGAARAQSFCF